MSDVSTYGRTGSQPAYNSHTQLTPYGLLKQDQLDTLSYVSGWIGCSQHNRGNNDILPA